MIERETGRAVDVTVIPTGHVPMVSAPEKVVNWILGLVSKVSESESRGSTIA
jgi:hypothetical protein